MIRRDYPTPPGCQEPSNIGCNNVERVPLIPEIICNIQEQQKEMRSVLDNLCSKLSVISTPFPKVPEIDNIKKDQSPKVEAELVSILRDISRTIQSDINYVRDILRVIEI